MVKGTELTWAKINELIADISYGIDFETIRDKYHIGYGRYKKISNKYSDKISELKREMALAQSKQFIDDSIIKRAQIIESIGEKDIKNAKLAQKTSAIVDLTNVKRLESGQSTENIQVITAQMSDSELRDYVLTGNVNVNKNDETAK